MSRYEIRGLDPKHEVVVGWDPPLQSYFAQVTDPTVVDEDDNPLLWLGADIPWIERIEDLEVAIRDYAVLTPELRMRLIEDRKQDRSVGRRPVWTA